MVDITFYLVTQAIAQRSGVIESRYRIKDGRFVLDNKDLSYIRFTPDEYIDGLEGVEKVSKDEAMLLIKENGYKMGVEKPVVVSQGQQQVESTDTTEEEKIADETENGNDDVPAEETTDSGENQDNENQEEVINEQEKEEE